MTQNKYTIFKLLVLIALCTGLSFQTQSQNYAWAKNIGGTSNDSGNSTTSDASGNVYITGYFNGTVDFDPGSGTENLTSAGSNDIFVAKFDASGNLIWAKSLGGTSADAGESITLDASGNIYITGGFNESVDFDPGTGTETLTSAGSNDIFVLKLDASGNFVWAKNMGGTGYDTGFDMAVDASGNVYTTGTFGGTADFDPGTGTENFSSEGSEDIFISKLDASGNFVWAKTMGGSNEDQSFGIALDASGNVYTTGYSEGGADFDPGPGTEIPSFNGNYDIFILKLDSSGNFVWVKALGGSGDDSGSNLTVDASGNIYAIGGFRSSSIDLDPGSGTQNVTSNGNRDVYLLKLDSSGDLIWAKSFGGSNSETTGNISIDASGNVYTNGGFSGTVDFDPGSGTAELTSNGSFDIFVLKLDVSGNFIWAKNMGGTSNDFAYGLTVDAFNNVYSIGAFQGTADFDPDAGSENLTSAGNRDIFVSKLSPPALSTSATLADFTATTLRASAVQSFTVSGNYLTADASVSLSTTDWELSTDSSNFSSTLTLSQSGGNLTGQPTKIYVRLKSGLSVGNKTATLSISSTDAITQTIDLNGTVTKTDQSITFDALSVKTVLDTDFDLAATASSGLGITYTSSNTAVATIAGNTVTIVGEGTTTITASQTGNDDYNAATAIAQTLTVNKVAQTITFDLGNQATKTYGEADFTISATGGASGNAVTFTSSNTDVATISGNTITITGAGTATITANQAGNNDYNAATEVTQTLLVNKADQVITFELGDDATKTLGEANFTISATGGASGNTVTFISSDANVATVSGNTVTIVGIGTTTITASQVGNDNYNAATEVTQILTIQDPLTALPQDLKAGKLTIFPNPVSNELRVKIEGKINSQTLTLSLINYQGKIIKQSNQKLVNGQISWPLQDLPTGQYLLQIQNGEETILRKIIKK